MTPNFEEYLPICAVYYMGEDFVASYDIDEEPIESELWFPDPRVRARSIIDGIAEAPPGYEIDESILEYELRDYGDSVEESLKTPFCSGGDLNPRRLLLAYSFGIFPWFDWSDPVPWWWAPLSRFVLFPEEIHISHSMRTILNKNKYRVTVNKAFPEVIEACRTVNGRHEDPLGGWLGEDIVRAYTELWRQGYVKSVEVWDKENGQLAGGLYGVWLNDCFMGESMFSFAPSGSKIAMIGLCEWMKENGGKVIDLQIETEHLKSMGGRHIPYIDYMKMLNPKAVDKENGLLEINFRHGNPIP